MIRKVMMKLKWRKDKYLIDLLIQKIGQLQELFTLLSLYMEEF